MTATTTSPAPSITAAHPPAAGDHHINTSGPQPTLVGARRRLQSLSASGYTTETLSRRVDVDTSIVEELITGPDDPAGLPALDVASIHRIATAFAHMQMVPGNDSSARRRGELDHWPLPLDWDEDRIDDAGYTTRRSRARGALTVDERSRLAAERRARVAELRILGWSAEEISRQLKVTERTIWRDIRRTSTSGGRS